MNFLERFFDISLFRLEGKTGKKTDITNRISQFHYAITNTLHIYRRSAKRLAFIQTVEPINHYFLSGQHSYTCGPLDDTIALNSEIFDFKYHAGGQSFRISLFYWMFTLLITSLNMPSWHFQFVTSCSTHRILCLKNPDIHLMCELHVTVKL